jgi:glycine/serine hydroxymethyltransferase
MMSLLDLAVFPGNQGPLMHIIAAKAVVLKLQDEFYLCFTIAKKC